MFGLKEIRDRFLKAKTPPAVFASIGRLVKMSESPAGFAAFAGAGLAVVLLVHALDEVPTGSDTREASPMAADAEQDEQDIAAAALPAPVEATEITEPTEDIYKLRRNETLIGLMRRAGFDNSDAHAVVNELDDVTNLRRLQRGQEIRVTRLGGQDGDFKALTLRDKFDSEAEVRATASGYVAERKAIPTIGLTHLVEGEITDSLYLSAKRAGLPTPVIVDLIRLMSFDVDFEREIRIGDRFQVYFERTYAPDFDDLDEGRILQVRLELKKRTLEASYFADANGEADYFDANGNSMRKTLMKTPLEVVYVTDHYGARKHPVLGYTRMHKGVDFRARPSTPIMAAGDGVIERASRWGTFGNYIRIKHNGSYKTAYAHLSKYGRGIKKGARVKQGQIIGYSGATGRVNGPHLHYEVLFNGKQVNPLTLKLPTGRSLKGENLTAFRAERTQLLADIDTVLAQKTIIANNQAARLASSEDSANVQSGDR